jgi:hypothetical protein
MDNAVCPCLLFRVDLRPFRQQQPDFISLADSQHERGDIRLAFSGSAPFASISSTQSAPAYIAAYINAVIPSSSLALASAAPDGKESKALAAPASESRIAVSSFSSAPLSLAPALSGQAKTIINSDAKKVTRLEFRLSFIPDFLQSLVDSENCG